MTVGVDESWCDHSVARIDDSIDRPVVVFPNMLYVTTVYDYAPIPENVMLIPLKGDNNLGVDPDPFSHRVKWT